MIVRQSTARIILVGPILDADGVAKTDEVVASIKVTKNGTVGAADGSATLTHDHVGKYRLALTASDTDTLGVLEISLNSGTNDMPVKAMNVVPSNVFDSLVAGSDNLQANATVSDKTGFKLAADGADLILVDGKTLPAALQIIAAVAAGKIADAGTDTETFLGLDGATTRVTVTVDSSGNRTAVVYG